MSITCAKILRRWAVAVMFGLLWIVFIYLLSAFVAAEFDYRAWESVGRFIAAMLMGGGALIAGAVAYAWIDNAFRYTKY